MRDTIIKPHCDDMYVCERYGLNRISLHCKIKIKMNKCPKYKMENDKIIKRNGVKDER